MEIVPFTAADEQETTVFFRTFFQEFGWTEVPEDMLNRIIQFFHLPDEGFLYLVKQNNKIIGTGGCKKLNSKEWLLKRFYIDKEYRGSGLAKQLLDKILHEVKSMQVTRIVIDVNKDNKRAIRFYEKNGFIKYHQSPVAIWPESAEPDTYDYFFLDI